MLSLDAFMKEVADAGLLDITPRESDPIETVLSDEVQWIMIWYFLEEITNEQYPEALLRSCITFHDIYDIYCVKVAHNRQT